MNWAHKSYVKDGKFLRPKPETCNLEDKGVNGKIILRNEKVVSKLVTLKWCDYDKWTHLAQDNTSGRFL
jgi:hypothetical protein